MNEFYNQILRKVSCYKNAKIVLVTKTRSVDEICARLNNSIKIIGENRIQEAMIKLPLLPAGIEKHFIGNLQLNKVKKAVALFDMIQSVGNWQLAEKINLECAKISKIMPILLQINISNDTHKSGFDCDKLLNMINNFVHLKNLQINGLMTIPKLSHNSSLTRKYYKDLFMLFKKIEQSKIFGKNFKEISMGMSDDYQIALEEGATMVRLGRIMF